MSVARGTRYVSHEDGWGGLGSVDENKQVGGVSLRQVRGNGPTKRRTDLTGVPRLTDRIEGRNR